MRRVDKKGSRVRGFKYLMLSGHPEQSEGSIIHWRDEILRFAQNDKGRRAQNDYLDLFVTCMCKRFLYRLHFKSDSMELYGIST